MIAHTIQDEHPKFNHREYKLLKKENDTLKEKIEGLEKQMNDWYLYKCELEKTTLSQGSDLTKLKSQDLTIEELNHKVSFLEELNDCYKNEIKILEDSLENIETELESKSQSQSQKKEEETDISTSNSSEKSEKKKQFLVLQQERKKKLENIPSLSLRKASKVSSSEPAKRWR